VAGLAVDLKEDVTRVGTPAYMAPEQLAATDLPKAKQCSGWEAEHHDKELRLLPEIPQVAVQAYFVDFGRSVQSPC
jgi:hypothetical protein